MGKAVFKGFGGRKIQLKLATFNWNKSVCVFHENGLVDIKAIVELLKQVEAEIDIL